MRYAGCNDIVNRQIACLHCGLGLYISPGIAPIPLDIHVVELEHILLFMSDIDNSQGVFCAYRFLFRATGSRD